jgi:flavorubredoxin
MPSWTEKFGKNRKSIIPSNLSKKDKIAIGASTLYVTTVPFILGALGGRTKNKNKNKTKTKTSENKTKK